MTYRGHIEKGVVVLEGRPALAEGTVVRVEPVDEQGGKTIWDALLELAGSVEGPEDLAENHDHYIHGTPKK